MFHEAEQTHRLFLSNQEWCSSYPELVKSYIIMAIALNNENFLSNLILDYPSLRQAYTALFDTWLFKTINPYDKRFGDDFIKALQMLELTKKIYEINNLGLTFACKGLTSETRPSRPDNSQLSCDIRDHFSRSASYIFVPAWQGISLS